jgi:hypothetical protein
VPGKNKKTAVAEESSEQEKPGKPRRGKQGSRAFEKHDKPGLGVVRLGTEADQIRNGKRVTKGKDFD